MQELNGVTTELVLGDASYNPERALVEMLYGAQLEALRTSLAALAAFNRASAEFIAKEQASAAEEGL